MVLALFSLAALLHLVIEAGRELGWWVLAKLPRGVALFGMLMLVVFAAMEGARVGAEVMGGHEVEAVRNVVRNLMFWR